MSEGDNPPLAAATLARVRESFARQTMMATFAARIVDIGPGFCRLAAPIVPGARQQQGFGHAALTFGLGDSAAGYAALTLMDEGIEVLTVEMKVNLLAPAAGARLVAEGRVVRAGRRLTVVTAEVRADGRAVALLQGTMIAVPAAG
ncbi:MAG: PaaI family thioesterase [Rhodobacteraceae bacterium]|nr:PaaI family thioesterase [Paracoccaceae bacterium]